ncbi:MAG: GDP-mannose 4,6-dehydratase [Bacteroidota bacterium]
MSHQHIIITGGAGFIGSTLAERLLMQGHRVTAIDNFDDFYEEQLKRENIAPLLERSTFRLIRADIRDYDALLAELTDHYDAIVHLAAKAGVRPSIKNPLVYQQVNVNGTQNLLEVAKVKDIKQFVFGSSSSVYGINPDVPWREDNYVLQPISPYASSKVSGELLGHVYSHLYGIRFLALRFFTVYGPRQRPDLAINKFVRFILEGKEIPVFGDGTTRRDYTYVGDIVKGIEAALRYEDSLYEIVNLGNHNTVSLSELIATIEKVLDKKALINRLPMQPGDVPQTFADIDKARRLFGYQPDTSLEAGITNFVNWYSTKLYVNG